MMVYRSSHKFSPFEREVGSGRGVVVTAVVPAVPVDIIVAAVCGRCWRRCAAVVKGDRDGIGLSTIRR